MPHITITKPGTLLPVIVDREITEGLAKAIVEMIEADDVVAEDTEDEEEPA